MKTALTILSVTSAFLLGFALPSCSESKGPAGKVGEKVDDALDQRPAEGVRDAVEDVVK
jgi:hypothetical protein